MIFVINVEGSFESSYIEGEGVGGGRRIGDIDTKELFANDVLEDFVVVNVEAVGTNRKGLGQSIIDMFVDVGRIVDLDEEEMLSSTIL